MTEEKKVQATNNGIKNGLMLLSIGTLMLMVMGVDYQTATFNNLGIFLTSSVIILFGIWLIWKNRGTQKGEKK